MATLDTWQLCCELEHQQDVRCVAPYPAIPGGVLTASYDGLVRAWTVSDEGEQSDLSTLAGHTGWVSAVCFAPPFIASCGWDNHVVLWNTATCQPEWILNHHTDKVSCIAVLEGGELVTGGYDKTAVIWKGGKVVATLRGHVSPVSCVCGLAGGDVVTGGAHGDNTVIRWSPLGVKQQEYKAHTSGVRGLCRIEDGSGAFASCSNDMLIIVWALDGTQLQTLAGHSNQVYSVASFPTGEIVSGSEDRTVKVWRGGGCHQNIEMPSFVFSVCALDNGDIAVGCTDGKARVLTRNPARVANDEVLKAFEQSVEDSKKKKSTGGGLDLAKLPGPEALEKNGTRDGQQLTIRRGDGAEVWGWSQQLGKWEKIGDVVDGPEGAPDLPPAKKKYNGKEWDYLFDVDLRGDGSGYFKLPYNKGENPYEAAQRFIYDNAEQGVGQHFLDEIAKFIIANAETGALAPGEGQFSSDYAKEAAEMAKTGATHTMSNWEALQKMRQSGGDTAYSSYAQEAAALQASGATAAPSVHQAMNEMGSGEGVAFSTFAQETQMLQSGAVAPSSSSTVPRELFPSVMVTYERANYDGMLKKLEQQNTEVQPPVPPADFAALTKTIQSAAQCTPESVAQAVPGMVHILENWPAGQRFGVLDLAKQLALTEGGVDRLISSGVLKSALALLDPSSPSPAAGPEEVLCLRLACNVFATARGQDHMAAIATGLLEGAQRVWKSKTPAVRRALIDLLTNYSLLHTKAHDIPSLEYIVPVISAGMLYEDNRENHDALLRLLGLVLLSSDSAVSKASLDKARQCFLSDSLRARPAPNPAVATLLELLLSALRDES